MSRPQDDRNQEATAYVGNLDDRATDALIYELMLQAGPVQNVYLPKDRISSAHQGFGFAEFQTEQDAEYACRIMNGIKLFGKPLRVNKASSDKKQIDIGANLFVGNLDANVDERTLLETFSTFGAVVNLPKVARDPTTNVSKNYGFVSFDSFEAADAAIESLNNQFLLNRPISVSYALKKDGKGERHGTAAERLLAAQARKNNALPSRGPPPMGMLGSRPSGASGPSSRTTMPVASPGAAAPANGNTGSWGTVPSGPSSQEYPPRPAGYANATPTMHAYPGQQQQPVPTNYSAPPLSGSAPYQNGYSAPGTSGAPPPPPNFMTGANTSALGQR